MKPNDLIEVYLYVPEIPNNSNIYARGMWGIYKNDFISNPCVYWENGYLETLYNGDKYKCKIEAHILAEYLINHWDI